MNPTVLLVHGAMHTPWIFDPLRARLGARGIATAAVQLPSSNPDSASTGGLQDDAATIRSAIEAIETPVVLAPHSYGGVPATWAAAQAPVAQLVYIAAFALPAGTSMLEWMGGQFPPDWAHSPDGLAVKLTDPEQAIFSGVEPALTAEAVKRLNWHGLGAFTQKLPTAGADAEVTYLVATEDPALPPEVQEQWAADAARIARIPSGHSPHLSHPDQVADILSDAVARAAETSAR